MPAPEIVLCAAGLGVIAALPRVFFRRGRLNPAWWLTAAPFMLAGAGLLWTATGRGAAAPVALAAAGTLLAAAALMLIGFTLGTHREPLALWHQDDDAPARLVTHGAYARVRHPFYLAFQLMLAGCLAAAPGPLTAIALFWGMVRLDRTAAREERRLFDSPFGTEYRAYVRRTGRFLPRLPAPGRAAQRQTRPPADRPATAAAPPGAHVQPAQLSPSGSGFERT